ncbi:hypothetical protein ANCDUO_15275 [Ancylostoma duodenale]|uniref:Uncharacterized protein n=1 Tax=Ancylostoma duodenale TaxID=51022 RepID=A0A0C2CE29_9BILA|nr:hypothetical protein ANCDUO_15275 [Ancylostoma duodenale]
MKPSSLIITALQKRQSTKSIRREIRMLSADERDRLWRAMNALKATTIDNITVWDLHTLVHYPDSAPGKWARSCGHFWTSLG